MTKELLPCPFERGQVWKNPDDILMMIFNVVLFEHEYRVNYVAENGQIGIFGNADKYILDNIEMVRPQPQTVDVEALKRELFEGGYNRVVRFDVLNALVDDVISRGYLRPPVKVVEGLFDAISIEDLPYPSTYEECDNIVSRYKDHEAIYGCDVSETLLEAARAHLKLQSGAPIGDKNDG